MNALWNKKDLERPANNIWQANTQEINYARFVSTVGKVIRDLESLDALHMEAAILSRLIYRMKSKFRSDKGLKNMEKVNRALLNYLELNLLKEYKDLKKNVEVDRRVVNLPTKQMLQYVLVRTQGFAKLMCRVEQVAKYSAEFFKGRLNLGHSWTVSVVAYSVVSRVWYLSRYLVKRCCAWYNSVFEYLPQFKQIGPEWLPMNYNLPINLKTWLDLPWIDEAMESVPLKDGGKDTIFSLIKANLEDPLDLTIDDDESDSPLKNVDPSNDPTQSKSKKGKDIPQDGNESAAAKQEDSMLVDDVGISIDRESFESEVVKRKEKTEKLRKSKKVLKRKKEGVSSLEMASEDIRIDSSSGAKKVEKLNADDDSTSPAVAKSKKKRLPSRGIKSMDDVTEFLK